MAEGTLVPGKYIVVRTGGRFSNAGLGFSDERMMER